MGTFVAKGKINKNLAYDAHPGAFIMDMFYTLMTLSMGRSGPSAQCCHTPNLNLTWIYRYMCTYLTVLCPEKTEVFEQCLARAPQNAGNTMESLMFYLMDIPAPTLLFGLMYFCAELDNPRHEYHTHMADMNEHTVFRVDVFY